MDQPARGRALAVRAGHSDQGPADRRVGDDLLKWLDGDERGACRPQLGVVGVHGGQGLGNRQTVGPGAGGDVGGVVGPVEVDAESLEGRRVRRGTA